MKIRLNPAFITALAAEDSLELSHSHKLVVYQPAHPGNDVEVRMHTAEGAAMLRAYEADKDKYIVAIATPQLDGNYEISDRVASRTTMFNSKADALKALCEDGVEVGFMPLLRASLWLRGDKAPASIAP